MAYKKKSRRLKSASKRKVIYPRQRLPYRRKNVVNRSMGSLGQGFPKKLMTTLKYNEYIFMNSATGSFITQTFSANGLFDPNATLGGHQPMFFDQMMGVYNHYHVLGSECTVRFVNPPVGNAPAMVGVFNNDDAVTLPTNYEAMNEQSRVRHKILGNTYSDNGQTVKARFSAKKIFGPNVLANNALRGNAGANPNEQQFFTIYVQSLDQISTSQVYAYVSIKYIVIFTELKDQAQS